MNAAFLNNIFNVLPDSMESMALEVFNFQYQQNDVYREFVKNLGVKKESVQSVVQIPFLPISFFKTHTVKTTVFESALVFASSGTTQAVTSFHYVKDATLYKRSFLQHFEEVYGASSSWCILALLPSYLERNNSSLVYMASELIKQSRHPDSGFYLNDFDKLYHTLKRLEQLKQPVILIGVTFALLDFFEKHSIHLMHTIVMETGGMKGRREEWTRQEVHAFIKSRTGLKKIHSEYGMTELLSQAYSKGDGIYQCADWMRVLVREEDDPLSVKSSGRGVLNIIDLANIYSCSFIATDDAGTVYEDGSFEVIGRVDNSDIRGCSLMTV
ncbi:MAG: acyl transferase [Sphingobacteriales bacterium]|nr:acyl transferase [Sphingobacteriales bacterium]